MRRAALLLALLATTAACGREKRYPLEGQVLAVDRGRQELTVSHGDIKGFMPGMTMQFKVDDAATLAERRPGDLIRATLVVRDSSGYLENVVRTGEAPLPADLPPPPVAMLQPGDQAPDAELTDQTGRRRRISDWRGATLAVTFVYTRCPLPDFCPVMDRNFLAAQRALKANAAVNGKIYLVSVSFDPDYDRPEVLRAHAKKVGADADMWTWLTGDRAAVDAFAAPFGVSIMRDDRPMQEIVHNLRTAVIGRDGRVRKIFNGNEWKAEDLVAALRAADAQ